MRPIDSQAQTRGSRSSSDKRKGTENAEYSRVRLTSSDSFNLLLAPAHRDEGAISGARPPITVAAKQTMRATKRRAALARPMDQLPHSHNRNRPRPPGSQRGGCRWRSIASSERGAPGADLELTAETSCSPRVAQTFTALHEHGALASCRQRSRRFRAAPIGHASGSSDHQGK